MFIYIKWKLSAMKLIPRYQSVDVMKIMRCSKMASENVKFSKLQQSVIDKYINGENIFISGPGGTGKSQLIKYIYNFNKDISKTQV